jgi:CelD/BcsL family acetyltransferase involved in cellulose biosynthesis
MHSRLQLGTYEEVISRLSRDHRQQVRRKARKLEQQYSNRLAVHCFSTSEEIDQLCAEVEEVAKKTYQRGLRVGFVDSAETRQRLALEARRSQLQVYVLRAAGQPVAYWWGTVYAGIFYSHALGYDPSLRERSPGTYLTLKVIEALCRSGLRGIDFGIGDARYKQQFATQRWEEASVRIFAPRIRPILLGIGASAEAAIAACGKKLLQHSKTLEDLKSRWRRRLARPHHEHDDFSPPDAGQA